MYYILKDKQPVPTREDFDTISQEDVDAIIEASKGPFTPNPKMVEAHRAAKKLFAPVPTSGAVEVARRFVEEVAAKRGFVAKSLPDYERAVADATPYFQQAMDGHENNEIRRLQGLLNKLQKPGNEPTRSKYREENRALKEQLAALTQPPAADGKLREALLDKIRNAVQCACDTPRGTLLTVNGWPETIMGFIDAALSQAPVPTSGAVEVVLPDYGALIVGALRDKMLGWSEEAFDALKSDVNSAFRDAIARHAAQPPAADGKLEALDVATKFIESLINCQQGAPNEPPEHADELSQNADEALRQMAMLAQPASGGGG